MAISQTDLDVRLQLSGIYYSDLAVDYSKSLRYGDKNIECKREKLILLDAYISILLNYDVTSENNCFTEDELLAIFDDISVLTKLSFKPIGYSYEPLIVPEVITYAIYYGSDAKAILIDTEVEALQHSTQKSELIGAYTTNANNYKYIAYPASFGTATSFINTLNGLNVPMATMFTVIIDDIVYNVHRSYYPIVSAVTIQIS